MQLTRCHWSLMTNVTAGVLKTGILNCFWGCLFILFKEILTTWKKVLTLCIIKKKIQPNFVKTLPILYLICPHYPVCTLQLLCFVPNVLLSWSDCMLMVDGRLLGSTKSVIL